MYSGDHNIHFYFILKKERREGRKEGGEEKETVWQILLWTSECLNVLPKPTFWIPRLCVRRPFFLFMAKWLVIRTAIRSVPFTEFITVTQCIRLIELSDTVVISVFTTTKTSTVLPFVNGSFESSTFQNGVIPCEICSWVHLSLRYVLFLHPNFSKKIRED